MAIIASTFSVDNWFRVESQLESLKLSEMLAC